MSQRRLEPPQACASRVPPRLWRLTLVPLLPPRAAPSPVLSSFALYPLISTVAAWHVPAATARAVEGLTICAQQAARRAQAATLRMRPVKCSLQCCSVGRELLVVALRSVRFPAREEQLLLSQARGFWAQARTRAESV
jgi:hypothetical protein